MRYYSHTGIFVGDRNSGKTTMLSSIVARALANGNTLFVFDSATKHCDKSLLKKCEKNLPQYRKFSMFHFSKKELFRLETIVNSCSVDIFLFDVSEHLEKSHTIAELRKRTIERSLYKRKVNEILKVLLRTQPLGKKTIVFDEIEITDGIAKQLNAHLANAAIFWGALHPHRVSNAARKHFDLLIPPFTQHNIELTNEVKNVQ
ncbi:MAG: hypothetical protein E7048_00015 [Lentisphaerae bacterium]|nr:hypothetical protein [Lentisphaerota bacterium]